MPAKKEKKEEKKEEGRRLGLFLQHRSRLTIETHGWVSLAVGLLKLSGSIFALVGHGRERRQWERDKNGDRERSSPELTRATAVQRERERGGVVGSLFPRPLGVDRGHPQWPNLSVFFLFAGNVAFAAKTHSWVLPTMGLLKPSGSIFAPVG